MRVRAWSRWDHPPHAEEIYDREDTTAHGLDPGKMPGWIAGTRIRPTLRAQKDQEWVFVVKMMVIIKDLMSATPVSGPLGRGNAGPQPPSPRVSRASVSVVDYIKLRIGESLLYSSFDWGRGVPVTLYPGHGKRVLNGIGMTHGKLMTLTPQFLQTCALLESEAVARPRAGPLRAKRGGGGLYSSHHLRGGVPDASGR